MIIFIILGLVVFGFPVLCFIAGLMGYGPGDDKTAD